MTNFTPPQQPVYGHSGHNQPIVDPNHPGFAQQAADERTISVIDHVLSLIFGIVPAIIFYFTHRHRGAFVRSHVIAQLNFRITTLILYIIPVSLIFIGTIVGTGNSYLQTSPGGPNLIHVSEFVWHASSAVVEHYPVGWFIFSAINGVIFAIIIITNFIFGIILAVKAGAGEFYRVPYAIRFIRN